MIPFDRHMSLGNSRDTKHLTRPSVAFDVDPDDLTPGHRRSNFRSFPKSHSYVKSDTFGTSIIISDVYSSIRVSD